MATEPLEACRQSSLHLLPLVELLVDPEQRLSSSEVLALPHERFQSIEGPRFPLEFSSAAIWLRFTLRATDRACVRWIKVGEPRLDNVQVFVWRAGQLSEMRAGSDFPISQWALAARQPLFPLDLEQGESAQVLVRVASTTVLMIDPYLWDEQRQQWGLEWSNLLDGLAIGIALIIVPFGLAIGLIRRSSVLLLNSLTILAYGVACGVVNGYLFYMPEWLPWKSHLVSVFTGITSGLFFSYIWVLFGVRVLPTWMRWAVLLYTLLISGLLLWGALGDYQSSRVIFSQVRWSSYLLVPLVLGAVWFYGRRRPNGLALGLTLLYVVQGGVRHLMDVKYVSWQYGEDQLGLTSVLPGVLLLVCTLVMEFRRGRLRERRALDDLAEQLRAEQERLEGAVARRTEQLRESLRARSMLLARISHDLRSPLASIIDLSRVIATQMVGDLPQRIERNARRQLEMIDELLEFSRSELQQLEQVLVPGYFYGFLREIEDEGRFLALRQNNRFACEFADDLPPLVQADFRRLRQILVNLLVNAGKFTRNGLIEFQVETVASDEHRVSVRFSISDSGIGIRAEDRVRLLQPFQRGSNASGFDGSGLGLSIVWQLLQQMGSELYIEPERERGAKLSFLLTMLRAAEDELESVLSDDSNVVIEGNERSVLIVDDLQQNRESLGDLLAGYGFDVLTASSGGQALAMLRAVEVDLLITDQMMSPMDGWALLTEARTLYSDLPVILYSAAPPLRPPGTPSHIAFTAVLLKPAASGEMVELVDKLASHGSTGLVCA
ncbi:MAG: 7TM-DISM domain-containing protein [Pseudomonas sp.]